jgi:hypothetical protein
MIPFIQRISFSIRTFCHSNRYDPYGYSNDEEFTAPTTLEVDL